MTLADDVAANQLWYHTLDLGRGVVTPGWFDLRSIVDRIPWPDVRGKRCLDVGTYDGFLAFELEKRGAAEVVATDIAGHEDWDWTPRLRARGPDYLREVAGDKHGGFELARQALDSSVRHEIVNIYDLDPGRMGTFDVVVCGSLLLHLRDPFRALEALRGMCHGVFLSIEEVDPFLARTPRIPLARLVGDDGKWMVPGRAGYARMLHAAGFDVDVITRPFVIPLGVGHPDRGRSGDWRERLRRAAAGGPGIPVCASQSRPAV